jgi:hypothetical protein
LLAGRLKVAVRTDLVGDDDLLLEVVVEAGVVILVVPAPGGGVVVGAASQAKGLHQLPARSRHILTILQLQMHCKKGWQFFHPQQGCHLPNSPWPKIIKLFPVSESLVSTSRLGTGKPLTFFTV